MKAKLNIRAIVLAEKLLGKPFGKFNLDDTEEWLVLAYGMVIANNPETFTLETFKKLTANKKVWQDMMKQIKTEFEYIGQFNDKTEKTEEAGDISISDLAATMIVEGINPDFVHGMRTTEIADILKAIDAKKKEQMEKDRFWTYLNILPHVDGKKLKSPENLITFPWEAEAKKKLSEAELEKSKAIFEKFIKSK